MSETDLNDAVRKVRDLRDKYVDLERKQKSAKKKAGKGGLFRGAFPRPQSRTGQKREIFDDLLKVFTDEKKRRQSSSEQADRRMIQEAVVATREGVSVSAPDEINSQAGTPLARKSNLHPPMKKISPMLSSHAPITRRAEVKAKSASKRILSHVSSRGRKNQARRDQKHTEKQ